MEGARTGHGTQEGSSASRAGQGSQDSHGKLRGCGLFRRRDGKDKPF